MGFDLYGLNPKIRLKHTDEYYAILEKYGKDGWLDWKKDIPEATKERYFELKDQYQEDNPGDYFRNNVWFWRPLWNFVCGACEDILTIEDMNAGGTNSGDGNENLNVKFDHDLEISFNSRYLIDITSQLDGEKIEIFLNDTGSPALIKDASDFDSIYVVMPMKG